MYENKVEDILKAQSGNKEIMTKLVTENSNLIWSIVTRFKDRGYEIEDLYQIGCIGFIKSIKVTCLEGVKQSDIEPWYQQYYYYLDEMGYCIQEDWWNMNPRVFVKFLEEDGRTVISYIATLKQ